MTQTNIEIQKDICPHSRRGNTLKNLDVLTGSGFDILQCRDCGLGWTDVPKGFDVAPFYQTSYYGSGHKKFFGLIEWTVKTFRDFRADFIQYHCRGKSGNILDIGCGRGWMLKSLKDRGWQCWGTEFSKESSQHVRKILGEEHVFTVADVADCRFPENHFDAVSLWHVFEHFPDHSKALLEIKRILKPGGLLVLEVPNLAGLQSRINAGRWIYLEAPRHFYHFSPKFMKELFQQSRFQVKTLSTFSAEFGPFGMVQSLLNLITPIPNFLFILLKRSDPKALPFSKISVLVSLIVTVIFLIPAVVIGTVLEIGAACSGRGGVIRMVVTNQK